MRRPVQDISDENNAVRQSKSSINIPKGIVTSIPKDSNHPVTSTRPDDQAINDPNAATSMATRTRAATKRNALGDVSNLQSYQIPRASSKPFPLSTTNSSQSIITKPKSNPTDPTTLARVTIDRSIDEQPAWDDLDAEERNDPSMVVEYVQDIFEYLSKLELKCMPDPDYMSRQNEITWKMRSVLVDWLIEIHWKLKLLPETLFLSVNLMDRFLSIRAVSLAKFQLVGVTSTLIASKYEEVLSPSVSNFAYLSDGGYDAQEILKAECYMLNSLQFNLSYPTPYVFLRRISKADDYDVQTRTLAKYFLESALLDHIFLSFPPSLLATTSLCLARKMLSRGDWNVNLIHYSGYKMEQISPVLKEFISFYQKPMKYDAVFKKYSSRKFMKASIFVKDYINKYFPSEITDSNIGSSMIIDNITSL